MGGTDNAKPGRPQWAIGLAAGSLWGYRAGAVAVGST